MGGQGVLCWDKVCYAGDEAPAKEGLVSRGQTTIFSPHGAYRRIISACFEKGSGTFTDHKLFFTPYKVTITDH